MKQYDIKIRISTNDVDEVKRIATALDTIYKYISTEDLIAVAGYIKNDPNVIKKVKRIAENPIVKGMFK